MSDSPLPQGTITKGIVHKKVEQLVNDHPDERQKLLAALKDRTRDYIQILVDLAGLTQDEAAPLRQAWYNPQGWWPAHQPIEPIVRQSLIKALDLAVERNLPLDSHWLCAGNQFQVIVTCNNSQVNRLILTPLPPGVPVPPTQPTAKMPIWLIKQGTGAESAGDENPAEAIEYVEEHSHVVTMQLKAVP